MSAISEIIYFVFEYKMVYANKIIMQWVVILSLQKNHILNMEVKYVMVFCRQYWTFASTWQPYWRPYLRLCYTQLHAKLIQDIIIIIETQNSICFKFNFAMKFKNIQILAKILKF